MVNLCHLYWNYFRFLWDVGIPLPRREYWLDIVDGHDDICSSDGECSEVYVYAEMRLTPCCASLGLIWEQSGTVGSSGLRFH